ncbi:cytochrome P450 2B4-like isoform X3 [Babylonia areolata]|uniref:cytochrome P450 2B4-like isoform X3 n=1 Tax=Babylonia areolata TaxID=304850 RepID=UPI003FD44797
MKHYKKQKARTAIFYLHWNFTGANTTLSKAVIHIWLFFLFSFSLIPTGIFSIHTPPMSVLTSSLDPTSLLLGGVVVLLCLLWWLSTRRPPGTPPGPGRTLPLLGHVHLLAKDPRSQFMAWKRQYGDVFSLYMGSKLVVVLASYSAIREGLVKFADVFSGRPHSLLMTRIAKYKGIGASSGSTNKEQRKVSLEILRRMGMGKNVLAERIQEEITHYIRAIKDHQGAPVDLAKLTQASVSNNICSIVFGQRYEYNDHNFLHYMAIFDRLTDLLSGTAILNFIPVLGYIPGDPFGGQEAKDNTEVIYRFMDKQVVEHKKTADKDTMEREENQDFIHGYLQQIQKHRAHGDVNTSLEEENLQKTLFNLFGAGTETTSTAIQWTLLYFLHYPHVQNRCFQEILDVVGPDCPPTMSDRARLTFLEATMLEVLRIGDIAPLSIFHASAYDVRFRGYVIPKDAIIVPALTCALQDPDIWRDPEEFRPERFIGPEGKLIRSDELIPFSMGRRMCLGESLARMEMFLYLATLVQHFRFLPVEEGQLPSLEGIFGLTHRPKPYKIRAVLRM